MCGCIRALPHIRYMQWPLWVVACPAGIGPHLCACARVNQSVSVIFGAAQTKLCFLFPLCVLWRFARSLSGA